MKEDRASIPSELSRELSLFHITMMGLGMMIGAGVFLGIGNAIRVAGPGGVLLTFSLNGAIAIFTALSYAELLRADHNLDAVVPEYNQEIAQELFIAEVTVRSHISRILDKLHLANRVQATLYALREGMVDLDENP